MLVCVFVMFFDCKLICGLYFKLDIGELNVFIGLLFVVVVFLIVIFFMFFLLWFMLELMFDELIFLVVMVVKGKV